MYVFRCHYSTSSRHYYKTKQLAPVMTYSDIPQILLHTDTIYLAPPTIDRAQEVHTLIQGFTQPHFEFLSWTNKTISLDDTYLNMKTAIKNFETNNTEYKFLIINKHSEDLLGCASLFIRQLRIPYFEVGYWIGSENMGRGYASAACTLIRDIAADFLGAKRIELKTARRNIYSIRVAQRAGFECEAILRDSRVDNAEVVDDTCVYVFTGASAR